MDIVFSIETIRQLIPFSLERQITMYVGRSGFKADCKDLRSSRVTM